MTRLQKRNKVRQIKFWKRKGYRYVGGAGIPKPPRKLSIKFDLREYQIVPMTVKWTNTDYTLLTRTIPVIREPGFLLMRTA